MFTNLMYLLLFAAALWCLVCKLPLPMAANWQNAYIYCIHDAFSDRAWDERVGE